MAKKLPKALRKEYTEKRFKKRLLSRTHTEKGCSLLKQHFTAGSDGIYRPAADVPEERRKELVRLAKEIKKNRSAVRKGRVILVVLVVGGIVAFNLLFKNMLLERAAERGLETAFHARSEVDDLRLSLLRGSLEIGAVRVADKEQPMENLFQIGPVRIRMLPVELLKGNVVIEEVSGRELQFGTPRETSGALERYADDDGGDGVPSQGDDGTVAELLPRGALNLPDPEGLVAEFLAGSESLRALEELQSRAEEARREWEGRLSELSTRVEEVGASLDDVRAIDPGSIDSPEEAIAAGRTLDAARGRVREVANQAEAASNALGTEIQAVRDIDDVLSAAVESDIDAVLDELPGFEGGVEGLVTGLVQGYLEERLGAVYGYGRRGLAIYERLGSDQDKEPRGAGRRGVVISFPSAAYPRFYLGTAAASVGNPQEGTFGEGSLSFLSSDPAMIDNPPEARYSERRSGRALHVRATLPAVQGGTGLADIEISLAGVDLQLPGGISQGVFDALSAESDADISLSLGREGTGRGTIDLLLRGVALTGSEPDDPIRRAIRSAMADAENIDFSGEFALEAGRIVALNGRSNLTDILATSVSNLLQEQRALYEARLREELGRALESRLADLREEQQELAELVDEARDLVDQTESWEELVDQRQRRVQQRAQELTTGAAEELREGAEDRIRSLF